MCIPKLDKGRPHDAPRTSWLVMMGKEKKKNKSFADALFLANFTNKKASTPVNSSCGGVRAGHSFLAQGLKAQTWPVT